MIFNFSESEKHPTRTAIFIKNLIANFFSLSLNDLHKIGEQKVFHIHKIHSSPRSIFKYTFAFRLDKY